MEGNERISAKETRYNFNKVADWLALKVVPESLDNIYIPRKRIIRYIPHPHSMIHLRRSISSLIKTISQLVPCSTRPDETITVWYARAKTMKPKSYPSSMRSLAKKWPNPRTNGALSFFASISHLIVVRHNCVCWLKEHWRCFLFHAYTLSIPGL